MSGDITSANSTISALFGATNIDFEGFMTDGAWTATIEDSLETRMGTDGRMSSGYTPKIKSVEFNFSADSPTVPKLSQQDLLQEATRTPIPVVMNIALPALKLKYTASGVMKNFKRIVDAGNVLQNATALFDFEALIPSPL